MNGISMVSCRSQEELQQAISTASPAKLVLVRGQQAQSVAPIQPKFSQVRYTYLFKTTEIAWTTVNSVSSTITFIMFLQNEVASLRSELGSLKIAAEEAEKAKEGLRTDNTRLTHRISYLEEQVAELLARHTQVV